MQPNLRAKIVSKWNTDTIHYSAALVLQAEEETLLDESTRSEQALELCENGSLIFAL